jgi:quercetin dioxygenase-like cupin family protein
VVEGSPIRRYAGALLAASALAAAQPALATGGEVVEKGITHQLVTAQKLPNVPGDSLTAVRVDLAPGALSPSHRHPGFVLA